MKSLKAPNSSFRETKDEKGTVEVYATFEGWKELGYAVLKGEKSIFKSPTGAHLFNLDQVDEVEVDEDPGWEDIH